MKKLKYLNGLFLLVCVLLINTCVIYAATEYEAISANDFMDPLDCVGRTFVIQGNIARAWGEVRETNHLGQDYNLGGQYSYYNWSTCRAGLYGITESGEEEEIIARDITSSTASCSELAGSLSFTYKITEEDANKYTLIVFKYSGTTASVPSYNPGRGYWSPHPASYSASCKREVLKYGWQNHPFKTYNGAEVHETSTGQNLRYTSIEGDAVVYSELIDFSYIKSLLFYGFEYMNPGSYTYKVELVDKSGKILKTVDLGGEFKSYQQKVTYDIPEIDMSNVLGEGYIKLSQTDAGTSWWNMTEILPIFCKLKTPPIPYFNENLASSLTTNVKFCILCIFNGFCQI